MSEINAKKIVRWETECHGTSRWPVYAILCGDCGEWSEKYGEISFVDPATGDEEHVCNDCAAKIVADMEASMSADWTEGQAAVLP